VTCPPNRCMVPIMNSSLSRRPSQARWRVSCRSPWPGGRRIPGATRQVRGHHRIVVIRRTGTTRDGMGSRRHPTSTDGRWPTGCYRSSPASVAASSWHSGALCGLRRCGHRSRCIQWPIRRSSMPLPEPPGKARAAKPFGQPGEQSPGQYPASPAPSPGQGPGQPGESPGSDDGRLSARSQDCKDGLGVKRRRGVRVRRVSKGTECDCHG